MRRNVVMRSRHADVDLIPKRQFLHCIPELIVVFLVDDLDIIYWWRLASFQFLRRLIL